MCIRTGVWTTLAAAAVLAAALFAVPGSGRAASLDAQEQAFVDRVNAWRAANGVPALTVNSQMSAAAQWMAEDNAARNLLTTVDSLGRDPSERLADYGVHPKSRAEFDAYGYESGAHLADSFFPGDFVLCDPKYTNIGVGRTFQDPLIGNLNWTWVVDLARFSGDPAPGPGGSCTNEPNPSPPATAAPTPSPTPAASPTTTPTGTPAVTPEPTDTPAPAASPTPGPLLHGDADCDGSVTAADALGVLRETAGLGPGPGCIAAGDVDCDGDRDSVDALGILRYVAGLPVAPAPGCPGIGTE